MRRFGAFCYTGTDNLGDEIQSLAAMAHLPTTDFLLDRDRLSDSAVASLGAVSVVMNGWYCQRPELWPPAQNIDPLFISMHLTKEKVDSAPGVRPSEFILADPVVNYLKQHAPIGARDEATVKLLQDAGVDSYFSGCMTLTLDRPAVGKADDLVVISDAPNEIYQFLRYNAKKTIFRTSHVGFVGIDQADRFARAKELLSLYARASCVITSRLHCALPCLAMGTPVILIEVAADRYRFAGLREFLHHCTAEEFIGGQFKYNVDNPPQNGTRHFSYREALIKTVTEFVEGDLRPSKPSKVFSAGDRDAAVKNVYTSLGRTPPNWCAKQNTYFKEKPISSDKLAQPSKIAIRAGVMLSGYIFETNGEHFGVSNALINGETPALRSGYVYKPHWREVP